MGSGGVAIAALPTVICLKVPFSDSLGGGAHLDSLWVSGIRPSDLLSMLPCYKAQSLPSKAII